MVDLIVFTVVYRTVPVRLLYLKYHIHFYINIQGFFTVCSCSLHLHSYSNVARFIKDVLFEVKGNVGVITLNRPKALNSLDLRMVRKIHPTLMVPAYFIIFIYRFYLWPCVVLKLPQQRSFAFDCLLFIGPIALYCSLGV